MSTSTRTTAWKQQRMTMLERLVDHGLLTGDGSTRLLVEDCVEWGGRRDRKGYGRYGQHGNAAHRAAYCVANQVTEDSIKGLVVRHSCDNPPCFNPMHLVLGTQLDNMHDMIKKGRKVVQSGESHWNVKLTDEQVEEIRALRGTVPQSQLANRFNVGQRSISRIQRGETRVTVAR